jgi:hypothetical protein
MCLVKRTKILPCLIFHVRRGGADGGEKEEQMTEEPRCRLCSYWALHQHRAETIWKKR